MDLISRQAAIDACRESYEPILDFTSNGHTIADSFEDILNALPSAEPQIIYCKDCKKHNKARGYSYDGTFVGIVDACPLVEIRGKAQGHEFDYQYCVYAKRRENEQI